MTYNINNRGCISDSVNVVYAVILNLCIFLYSYRRENDKPKTSLLGFPPDVMMVGHILSNVKAISQDLVLNLL